MLIDQKLIVHFYLKAKEVLEEQLKVLEDMLDLMAKVVSVPGAAPSVIDTGAGVKASVSNDFWPNCGLCCE